MSVNAKVVGSAKKCFLPAIFCRRESWGHLHVLGGTLEDISFFSPYLCGNPILWYFAVTKREIRVHVSSHTIPEQQEVWTRGLQFGYRVHFLVL